MSATLDQHQNAYFFIYYNKENTVDCRHHVLGVRKAKNASQKVKDVLKRSTSDGPEKENEGSKKKKQ
jgi:hypothetical protein